MSKSQLDKWTHLSAHWLRHEPLLNRDASYVHIYLSCSVSLRILLSKAPQNDKWTHLSEYWLLRRPLLYRVAQAVASLTAALAVAVIIVISRCFLGAYREIVPCIHLKIFIEN